MTKTASRPGTKKPRWVHGDFWLGDLVYMKSTATVVEGYGDRVDPILWERKIRGEIKSVDLALYDDGSGIHIQSYTIAWRGEFTGLYVASIIEPHLERIGDRGKMAKSNKVIG
jgi:hypothetical protein